MVCRLFRTGSGNILPDNRFEGRFRVVWEPKYVKFAGGRELDSGL